MDKFDIAVMGGTVVSSTNCAKLNIGIKDGKIRYLGTEKIQAKSQIPADGLMLLPGGVDTHIHLMEPGATEREDYAHGTKAAARAGVTTIVEHTHAQPIRTPEDLTNKRNAIKGAHVDYGMAAHAWPGMADQVAPLWHAGISFFKVFTCTTHGIPGHDAGHLRQHLKATGDVGALSLIHCENESLCAVAEEELKALGRNDNGIVPEWRNKDAEVIASIVAAVMVKRCNARANIAHVSHPEVADYIARERALGADVMSEVCPQYFLLRENEVLELGALRKFTPPARMNSDKDEAQMWQLLKDRVLSYVSSDHAPSTLEQKKQGDIWNVQFGLPGVDTTFPALIDAVSRGQLSWPDVARVYAETAARRFGFWGKKGAIRLGFDADIAFIDPTARYELQDEQIESKAGWSPYSGRTFTGKNIRTLLRGQTIFDADNAVLPDYLGEYLPGPGFKGNE